MGRADPVEGLAAVDSLLEDRSQEECLVLSKSVTYICV
jgi:hypothetical protein